MLRKSNMLILNTSGGKETMGENRFPCGPQPQAAKETVCIETNKVLDSCRDRDCFENVKVILTDYGKSIIAHTTNVRVKDACISWTYIGIEPVRFNRGFYSINIKFYIKLCFEACIGPGKSQEFEGIAILEKKVILYGSESNVSIFKSNSETTDFCTVPELSCAAKNIPIAIVEVIDPIVLSTKVREPDDHCECCCCCCCSCRDVPESLAHSMHGSLCDDDDDARYLTVSLGIFSVVRIVRPAQYLINATEYCIPDKECISAEEDDPCAIFRHMSFPTSEFCPPDFKPEKHDRPIGKCGC